MTPRFHAFQIAPTLPIPQIWLDLLPRDVAIAQAGWERAAAIRRASRCGVTLREIGRRFGISAEHARRIKQARVSPIAPAQRWASPVLAAHEVFAWLTYQRAAPIQSAPDQPPPWPSGLRTVGPDAAAHMAGLWVSGYTQKQIAAAAGLCGPAPVCHRIMMFIQEMIPEATTRHGYRLGSPELHFYGQERRELAARACVRYASSRDGGTPDAS